MGKQKTRQEKGLAAILDIAGGKVSEDLVRVAKSTFYIKVSPKMHRSLKNDKRLLPEEDCIREVKSWGNYEIYHLDDGAPLYTIRDEVYIGGIRMSKNEYHELDDKVDAALEKFNEERGTLFDVKLWQDKLFLGSDEKLHIYSDKFHINFRDGTYDWRQKQSEKGRYYDMCNYALTKLEETRPSLMNKFKTEHGERGSAGYNESPEQEKEKDYWTTMANAYVKLRDDGCSAWDLR